jgi:hypothetical protein
VDTIDVCMTATIRPEIVDLTLQSFTKRFLNQYNKKRLIINIDPIGDSRYSQNDILDICKKYFDDIKYRCPNTPSFPSAVQWCWSNTQSRYILHLEDDWLLKKKIDKGVIESILNQNSNVVYIRFNLSRNNKFKFDREFYTTGFSLNPSIIKKEFIDKILMDFNVNKDPEKQFNKIDTKINRLILYGGAEDGYYVEDIGKKWRKAHKFSKPDITLSKNKSWKIDAPKSIVKELSYIGK